MAPLTEEELMGSAQAPLLRTGLDAYRREAQSTNFKLKFRGYAPREVDVFVDRQLELYEELEAQLQSVRDYEHWLKEVVREQVIARAQQEAEDIRTASQKGADLLLQEARQEAQTLREDAAACLRAAQQEAENTRLQLQQEQEQSRKTASQLLAQTQEDCSKQRRDAQAQISQERDAFQQEKQDMLAQWNQEQAILNQKLQKLRNKTAMYRAQVSASLEKALAVLRQDPDAHE